MVNVDVFPALAGAPGWSGLSGPTQLIAHATALSLYLLAAAGLYLVLLNRYLIQLHDSEHKRYASRGVFALILGGGLLLGLLAQGPLWLAPPGAILALLAVGEIRRVVIRRQTRGTPP